MNQTTNHTYELFPFTITINDEYSTYEYKMKFPGDVSIYDLIKALGEKFEVETPTKGKCLEDPIKLG